MAADNPVQTTAKRAVEVVYKSSTFNVTKWRPGCLKMRWVLGLLIFLSINAGAAAVPALYCVSTKTFNSKDTWPVNQINIFTNAKGILKMSLQFHAWGQSEEEDATVTTKTLLSLKDLSFDSNSGTLKNLSGKFELKLGEELSPTAAKKILNAKKVSFSFEDPAGMLVDFKKYHRATLISYEYPGKKEEWSGVLMEAFKAGVNEYICGDIKDAQRD